MIVEVKNISKTYNNTPIPAVDNVSFSIEKGQIFGLLGPNGAGKSTTISMLCGLLKPNSGSIAILGEEINKNTKFIKSRIGLAGQSLAVFKNMTAAENIDYFAALFGMNKAQIQEAKEKYLNLFALNEVSNKLLAQFSGGMLRRFHILVALLHNPELIVLDEPTTGVDIHSRRQILDLLLKFKTEGKTILYTSHILSEAEEICDRFAIMDSGKILLNQSKKELFDNQQDLNLDRIFMQLTQKSISV